MELDLLSNDWICEALVNDLEITILDGPKYGGQLQITSNNKVNYTVPNWNQDHAFDKFSYRVSSKIDPTISSISAGYINFDNTCFFSPGGGGYTLALADASSSKLNPLFNSVLCGYTTDDVTIRITNQPQFGTATVNADKSVSYQPANLSGSTYTDLIVYEACLPNNTCGKSIISLKLTSPVACTGAVDDVVSVLGNQNQVGGFIFNNVTDNDCNSNQITSIRIVTPPTFGNATVTALNPKAITYTITNPSTYNNDELEYEVCQSNGTCSRAKVFIKRY